jgi:hypothetical protein
VLGGLEGRVLVDLIEQAHQALEEDPRSDPHLATELTGHPTGQPMEHGVIDLGGDPLGRIGGVQLADPPAHLHHAIEIEGQQADLGRARAIERGVVGSRRSRCGGSRPGGRRGA